MRRTPVGRPRNRGRKKGSDRPRAIVYIDEANVYHDARRAFFTEVGDPPSRYGQFNPMRYAMRLCSRIPLGVSKAPTLEEARVYTGMPSSSKDRQSYAAHRRQIAAWEKAGATVIARSLRYPVRWPEVPPEQKGIDVQIALDVVVMALQGRYDVAILASTDTDLKPAIEAFAALDLAGDCRIEVAAWKRGDFAKKLTVAGQHVWCHFLEEDDYEEVRDRRDYNVAS